MSAFLMTLSWTPTPSWSSDQVMQFSTLALLTPLKFLIGFKHVGFPLSPLVLRLFDLLTLKSDLIFHIYCCLHHAIRIIPHLFAVDVQLLLADITYCSSQILHSERPHSLLSHRVNIRSHHSIRKNSFSWWTMQSLLLVVNHLLQPLAQNMNSLMLEDVHSAVSLCRW